MFGFLTGLIVALLAPNPVETAVYGDGPIGIAAACALDDRPCLSAELERRRLADQAVRDLFAGASGTSDTCTSLRYSDEKTCMADIVAAMLRLDIANTARLKQIISVNGWPEGEAWADDAQQAAWTIAQHARTPVPGGDLSFDCPFARSVLPDVEDAAARGDLSFWQAKAMADRLDALSRPGTMEPACEPTEDKP